jgi:hypothetical protein
MTDGAATQKHRTFRHERYAADLKPEAERMGVN